MESDCRKLGSIRRVRRRNMSATRCYHWHSLRDGEPIIYDGGTTDAWRRGWGAGRAHAFRRRQPGVERGPIWIGTWLLTEVRGRAVEEQPSARSHPARSVSHRIMLAGQGIRRLRADTGDMWAVTPDDVIVSLATPEIGWLANASRRRVNLRRHLSCQRRVKTKSSPWPAVDCAATPTTDRMS